MKMITAILFLLLMVSAGAIHAQNNANNNDRITWLHYLDKLAKPILSNLAEDKLKEKLPLVLSPSVDNAALRTKAAYLEAFGRVMTGIAPWLNLEGGSSEEIKMRGQFNRSKLFPDKFEWADKYYAVSVSESQLDKVKKYIDNQEAHHQKITFKQECDEFIIKYGFTELG